MLQLSSNVVVRKCGLEIMKASIKALLDNYQVRKTRKQKQAFINWLKKHAEEHGYQLDEQVYKKNSGKNLIVGDPQTADIFLTAHYDTPPNALFPIATFVGNIPLYLLSQLLIFIPIIAIAWFIHFLTQAFFNDLDFLSAMTPFFWFEIPLLSFILLILWCIQMMFGFANRKNANDNTSGVSVLLSVLEDLPTEQRNRVCFVFFDEEEKGLIGSKKFKERYQSEVRHKPLINFDCVAHGSHLMFITKKEFRKSKFNTLLSEVTQQPALAGNSILIKEARKYVYPSDQLLFKNSVGVTVVHKIPLLGYYLSRLHASFDSKFNFNHIENLNLIMIEFINKMTDLDE